MALANWAGDPFDNIGRVISNHSDFALVVRHELRRSERYCSFVSMLTVVLEGLDERLERKFPADYDTASNFVTRLTEAIRATVRSTDIVSGLDRDRVGLLLVETPRDGATVLANRLQQRLMRFLKQTGELTSAMKVRIKIGSFPGEDNRKIERMLREFAS